MWVYIIFCNRSHGLFLDLPIWLCIYLFLIEAMGYFDIQTPLCTLNFDSNIESWIDSMFILNRVLTMYAFMHSCCSWINYDTVQNLNLLCRWCNAPKKKSRECLWVVECWNSIQVPKRHSRDFFNSSVLACIIADSLSKSRLCTRIVCQNRVYVRG